MNEIGGFATSTKRFNLKPHKDFSLFPINFKFGFKTSTLKVDMGPPSNNSNACTS